jgi:hypothetical protein
MRTQGAARQPLRFAPIEKGTHRDRIRRAPIAVPDLRRGEIDERETGALATSCNEYRHNRRIIPEDNQSFCDLVVGGTCIELAYGRDFCFLDLTPS